MMKFFYGIPAVLVGMSVTLMQPRVTLALSAQAVSQTAKQITVLIESDNQNQGSGIIIKHSGSTYYILTALHVVEQTAQYSITTVDGKHYTLDQSRVKKIATGVDLAVVQFSSNQAYQVAHLGNSDQATEGATVYVAGFPVKTAVVPTSIYRFVSGQMTANASQALPGGYALIYSDNTLPGMSGGPVLNENSEVIGVHGEAETTISSKATDKSVTALSTGNNLGIPINTFTRLSTVDVGVRPPIQKTAAAPTADDFYLLGVGKYNKQDYQGAIANYNQALRLNPSFTRAYNSRGVVRDEQGDLQGALADYNQALRLNPNFALAYNNRGGVRQKQGDLQGALADYNQALRLAPNYAAAYNDRGVVRQKQGDKQGALEDYNQALRLAPNAAPIYYNRGSIRNEQGDLQGALADYNQALRLNPSFARAYNNRGLVRADLGDRQGALEDYNQALRLDPNNASTYYNRGVIRGDLGDRQGALADFQQALRLNPNDTSTYYNRGVIREHQGDLQGALADFQQALRLTPNLAPAYNSRGLVRQKQGDKQGALADFNQALRLDPNYAITYYNRGVVRADLGDRQGALADFQQAEKLAQQQGNAKLDQAVQEEIKKLQQ